MKTVVKIPTWFCETHLRTIEDLADQGEYTEAKEMTAIYRNEYLLCQDCRNLKRLGA